MKTIFTSIILLYAFYCYSQVVDIPQGVVYHKTTEAKNQEAKKFIKTSVDSMDCSFIFDSTVMVGPNLWSKFLKSKYATAAEIGINLNFRIPTGNEVITRKGRVINKTEDFKPIWKYISNSLRSANLRVPSKAEIQYYWSIIAYDIEEPIYVMESSDLKVLFNLTPTTIGYST
jgi:hypothetical protein